MYRCFPTVGSHIIPRFQFTSYLKWVSIQHLSAVTSPHFFAQQWLNAYSYCTHVGDGRKYVLCRLLYVFYHILILAKNTFRLFVTHFFATTRIYFRKNYVNKDFRPITLFSSLFSKRAANMQKGRVKRARASQITEKKVRVEGGRERGDEGRG